MRKLIAVVLALAASACGGSSTSPSGVPDASITVTGVFPNGGGLLLLPPEWPYIVPGGAVLPRSHEFMLVNVSLRSARPIRWARLNIYLLTGGTISDYCGMNDPDAPTWTALPAGWSTTYGVSGFRIYSIPCDVTGVRAMLHTRNDGRLAPPSPEETIAETIVPASFRIRR